MSNEPTIHEPQSLLDVREWKRKTSEEIERIGFKAFREKCQADPAIHAMRDRIERNRKLVNKAS